MEYKTKKIKTLRKIDKQIGDDSRLRYEDTYDS